MTWVKICGITNLEDARIAVDAGADALGFVFYEKSPRNVDPETVREIVRQLPANVEKVGVFVSESRHQIQKTADRVGLTGVQLHLGVPSSGDKRAASIEPLPKIKGYVAVSIDHCLDDQGQLNGFAWSRDAMNWINGVFLDSSTPQQPGGTGVTFDWQKAKPASEAIQRAGFHLVVAGGLTPGNVAQAMRILKPWGVDVSSGVELTPGKKDPDKIQAFVSAVRAVETLV